MAKSFRVVVEFRNFVDENALTRLGMPVLNEIKLLNALVTVGTREQLEDLSDDPNILRINYSDVVQRRW